MIFWCSYRIFNIANTESLLGYAVICTYLMLKFLWFSIIVNIHFIHNNKNKFIAVMEQMKIDYHTTKRGKIEVFAILSAYIEIFPKCIFSILTSNSFGFWCIDSCNIQHNFLYYLYYLISSYWNKQSLAEYICIC